MAGLSQEGFSVKTLEQIKTDIEQSLRAEFGDINLRPDSVFGQLVGSFTKQLADVWESMGDVYLSHYPNSAEGKSLDGVLQLSGARRLPETKTEVVAHLASNGVEDVLVTRGNQVTVGEGGAVFELMETVNISSSNAVAATININIAADSTNYTVSINSVNFQINSGVTATRESIALALVNSINAGTEPVVAEDNLDGTFTVSADDFETVFAVTIDANMQYDSFGSLGRFAAQEAGPVVVPAGSLNQIQTPVTNWAAVTNPSDGVVGRSVESDPEFRLRGRQSVRILGAASTNAIRARLLQEVENVSSVQIFENRTDTVDGVGRPPHSFEAVVQGGENQDIANKLFEVKPAGIEAYGTTALSVLDSQGDLQPVAFTRPSDVFVWVECDLVLNAEEQFPSNGIVQVAEQILVFGETLNIGEDVLTQRFYGSVFKIPGISSITIRTATSAAAGGAPSVFSESSVAIDTTQIASFDSSRITVAVP